MTTYRKRLLKSEFALFQTSSNLICENVGRIFWALIRKDHIKVQKKEKEIFVLSPSVREKWRIERKLKNHDEVHDDDVCWLGKDWNENVSFGGKKET